jgi:ketosteroid isomerase-like protein
MKMKYLCLAYGDEKDWNALLKSEQDALLAQDEVLRERGALMAAVKTTVTTVRAWDGTPKVTDGAFADPGIPLAGFSVIEAGDVNEVINLVAQTPCVRAKGAIEVRPILAINNAGQERVVMTSETGKVTDEDQIRTIIEERVKAVGEKDSNALLSVYVSDILSFDVVNPLQNTGIEAVKKRAVGWLSSFQSSIGYAVQDLSITTGDTAAFCHYLFQVSGTLKDGAKVGMYVRATTCLHKVNDKWQIVHEHQSVPFDAETGKASLDLKP